MWQGVSVTVAALSLVGCASTVSPIPPPKDSDSAGLVIDLKVRVSGLATYRADVVYFVKSCSDVPSRCDDHLITSNYAKEGRVYLLNVPPGEYHAVAAAFESGVFGDTSLYFAYFPSSLVNESSLQVVPRRLVYGGIYLVSASLGVCPESAESSQLKYAEMIEPGTPKCGFFRTLMHKLGSSDYMFVGGKAYSVGKQTYHYHGTTYEKQKVQGGELGSFGAVLNDLVGTGWEGIAKPEH